MFTGFALASLCVRFSPDRKRLMFDLVNLSSEAHWFSTEERNENFERLEVTAMRQLEKDVVVVCYNRKLTRQGRLAVCQFRDEAFGDFRRQSASDESERPSEIEQARAGRAEISISNRESRLSVRFAARLSPSRHARTEFLG